MKRIWPRIGEPVMVAMFVDSDYRFEAPGVVGKVNRRHTGWCPRSVYVRISKDMGAWWNIEHVRLLGEF